MKRLIALLALALSATACATTTQTTRNETPSALGLAARSADCDAAAQRLVSPEGTTATAPWSGTPWTDAREWGNATASSKAQIERDIRSFVYRDCLTSGTATTNR